ncbi:hypothetical protein F5880DRAFT_1183157 [Lentinula raphanica]|nr:hypothetical protein F5880DRAFT_1183157 [Lentinula raphanica]
MKRALFRFVHENERGKNHVPFSLHSLHLLLLLTPPLHTHPLCARSRSLKLSAAIMSAVKTIPGLAVSLEQKWAQNDEMSIPWVLRISKTEEDKSLLPAAAVVSDPTECACGFAVGVVVGGSGLVGRSFQRCCHLNIVLSIDPLSPLSFVPSRLVFGFRSSFYTQVESPIRYETATRRFMNVERGRKVDA